MSLALPCSCGRERDYFDNVFDPALKAAGSSIEYLGELAQSDRDTLLSTSSAALMPGAWPEPFGLVAIEALAGVCASSSTKTLPEVGSNTIRPSR